MVGDGTLMVRLDIHTCLSRLLLELLTSQRDASFDEGKFDRIYCELEEYFYGDTLRRRVIAPLTDFGMDAETIALGGGLSIIRLTRAEREEFASRSFMFPLPPLGSHGPTGWEEFGLELKIEVPKVIGKGSSSGLAGGLSQTAAERLDESIAGLRLFKTGAVAYNSTNVRSIAWEPNGGGGSIVKPPVFGGPRYVLSEEEIPAFEHFWRDFQRQHSRRSGRIDLALRRFNLAYERILSEDRLIE